MAEEVDFKDIALKWQKRWEEKEIFKVTEDHKKKKYYVLEMYPYPSGKLHMGHVRNYSIGDSFARYKRMQGFNVLYPMGYDAFGLPAENAAIKNNTDPEEWTWKCINNMKAQQKMLGLSYDWNRQLQSIEPDYYRWNQWVFLQMKKKGLAFKKAAPINWCPSCGTVLANEQVENGKCWRCKTEVEEKNLEQWFYNIKAYAEELLNGIDKLEHWPEKVKIMQRNWIGKSHGTVIDFKIVNSDGSDTGKTISTFTTRPDTVFGITYLVLAVEHPIVLEIVEGTEYEHKAKEFIKEVKKKSVIERTAEGKEKNGMFLGKYFINPVNNEKCPLWVADYALYEYGTGAVMAVPTHDQRDFEFARKYKLPMRVVIQPNDGFLFEADKMTRAFCDEGTLVNSEDFNGMNNNDAIEEISKWMEEKGHGKRTVNYKLRDWLISRQRYWGTPIPIIYCEKCGAVDVPEKDLPVMLPKNVKFTGEGNPLAGCKEFVDVSCPKCNGKGRRETDTMDTFIDSSWYFIKYCSPGDKGERIFDKNKVKYWMSVDQYIGGIEHAILHLLYARFYTKILRDLGLVEVDEPFTRLLCQGMVIKDGAKMSKSLGNIVDPEEIINMYGPDTARIFILFTSLPEKELDWNENGVNGSYKFLRRVHALCENEFSLDEYDISSLREEEHFIISRMHKTIRDETKAMDEIRISHAIQAVMEFVNDVQKYSQGEYNKQVYGLALKNIAILLNPFAPHLSEEIWEKLGQEGFSSLQQWPECEEGLINEEAEIKVENLNKIIADIKSVIELRKIEKASKIRLFVSAEWKYDTYRKVKEKMEETRNIGDIIKAAMMPEFAKEISMLVPRLIKDPSKIPLVILDQKNEFSSIKNHAEKIRDEFGCVIDLVREEDSKEEKAKNAAPGKPAILIE